LTPLPPKLLLGTTTSLGPHKAAHQLLSGKLAEYQQKLVPELETILSAKTLTSAQAEETVDLEKLYAP
jgi:hypothetical protein